MANLLPKYKLPLSVLFFLIVASAYAVFNYENKKNEILKGIDERLLSAAVATQSIMGHNFADKSKDASSISPQEDMQNILTLSKLAKASDIKYVYIMVLDKDTIRFITSSATDEEIITGSKLTRYFDKYDSNPNILKAFQTKQVVFDASVQDEWGEFRSVFVPYTSANGREYVVAADIDLRLIDVLSRKAALNEMLGALLILLSLSPLLYLLSVFKKDNTVLQFKIDEATKELKEINDRLQNKVNNQADKIIKQFYHDTLTGLPNRNKMQEDLRGIDVVAVALIDIDDFKEVNDYFGANVGDNILKQFAKFLDSYHKTYRLSGDVFGFIFDGSFTREMVADKIKALFDLAEEEEFSIETQIISIRLSVGLAFDANANLVSADIALHKAKDRKIQVAIYNEDEKVETIFKHNLKMASTIKNALANKQLICYYQPIVSFSDGSITKYETLARLLNENNEIVHPVSFLKLAQKTRHYPQITAEVVRQACSEFANRSEQFSINLSNSDMINQATIDIIVNTIKETGTSHRVIFEITEAEGIENFEAVSAFITTVKELGAKIAIDDFGTGYSNFENILKLNIDFVKIDGSLIRNIDTDMKHSITVETIVEFAKKIGAQTVAEYVWNKDVYEKTKTLGVDYAQGFFVGKPASFDGTNFLISEDG